MLDEQQRLGLTAAADALIPSSTDMPSASQAGVPERLIDVVLAFRPDLREAFGSALSHVDAEHPEQSLEALSQAHPDQFAALSTLVAGAYFLSPDVRRLLHYAGGTPRAVHDDVDDYVDLLEHVVVRGPVFRTV